MACSWLLSHHIQRAIRQSPWFGLTDLKLQIDSHIVWSITPACWVHQNAYIRAADIMGEREKSWHLAFKNDPELFVHN